MANATTAAGNNGVAGNYDPAVRTVTGAYGTTYSDNGNRAVSDNHAVRRSVAKTQKGYGSAVNASNVYSETQNYRTAYAGVEADSPALDASRTAA
jgi:hypothetical protein